MRRLQLRHSKIAWGFSMAHKKEIIGNIYGRLMPILECGKNSSGQYRYLSVCECGESKVVTGSSMVQGKVLSCGCLRRDTMVAKNTKHNGCGTSTYETWAGMKTRCTNPNGTAYANYGGRGITFNPAWADFAVFASDMGERPDGCTLERIDNDKGYSKDNCKWATAAEQSRNTRQNVNLTLNGKTQCMTDWAKELSIPYPTIQDRVRKGWSAEKTLTR